MASLHAFVIAGVNQRAVALPAPLARPVVALQAKPNRADHTARLLAALASIGVGSKVYLGIAPRQRKSRCRLACGGEREAETASGGIKCAVGKVSWDRESWIKGYDSARSENCYLLNCGSLPADLKGTYFRNGPAKFKVGKDQIRHPFDGDGMVSAVTFDGSGKAYFRNRFVRTQGFVEELEAGRMLYRGQFSPKEGGWIANAFDMRVKNLANTNVMHWAGRVFALWEGGKPTELDPLSLGTRGISSLGGALKSSDNFTAHPRYDAWTGRLVGFQYQPQPLKSITQISFWEFKSDGFNLHRRVDQELPGFGFYHDFLVTENYYILSRAPVDLSGVRAMQGLLGIRSMGESISFDSTRPAQLVLVPRDGSQLKFIDVDPHFCFHFANGFEKEGGNIVIDMVRVPDFFLGDASSSDKPVWATADMESLPLSSLWRYEIAPTTGQWSKRQLCDRYLDFPSINRRFSGKPYRYVFCATTSLEGSSGPLQGLIRVDAKGQEKTQVWFPDEPHEFLGEPVFCPRVGAGSEHDEDYGYIVGFLLDGRSQHSDVVVFDAKQISKGPICRLPTETYIPHGLHGCFAPELVPSNENIAVAWFKSPTSL